MKPFKLIFCLLAGFSIISISNAQSPELEKAKQELTEMNELEQNAFINGDCEALVNMMDPAITFYANGRKAPNITFIKTFCERLPRPFDRKGKVEVQVVPLSAGSGYVVQTIEFTNAEGQLEKREVVTKTWKKSGDSWKMTHFHSSVTQLK